jgi:hypothetical protein
VGLPGWMSNRSILQPMAQSPPPLEYIVAIT